MITKEMLVKYFEGSEEYISCTDAKDQPQVNYIIDGHFNLEKMAEFLNKEVANG